MLEKSFPNLNTELEMFSEKNFKNFENGRIRTKLLSLTPLENGFR